MSDLPTLTICMPAYNAAKTLEQVVKRIPIEIWAVLDRLIIVNDGSRDETETVIVGLSKKYPAIQWIQFERNQGYGHAVREGLKAAMQQESEYVVCLHSDGQYAPEKLPDMLQAMEQNKFDLLQGSRHLSGQAHLGGMPFYKILAGKFLTVLENICFGMNLTDYHSGYLIYRRLALMQIPLETLSAYFEFDLELIASARSRKMKIGEIAIPTRYADEKSYLNPIRYGFRVLKVMWNYRRGLYG